MEIRCLFDFFYNAWVVLSLSRTICVQWRLHMLDELQLIEAIAPDILLVIQERYRILQNIYWMQPVGRRTLAESVDMTERVLRTETDLLRKLNLIDSSKCPPKPSSTIF